MKTYSVTIAWGEFLPDGGEYQNAGLVRAKNVVPAHTGYVFEAPRADFTDMFAEGGLNRVVGSFAAEVLGKRYQLFFGCRSKSGIGDDILWQAEHSANPVPWGVVNVSPVAPNNNTSPGGPDGWHFTQFGDNVIACPGRQDIDGDIRWKNHRDPLATKFTKFIDNTTPDVTSGLVGIHYRARYCAIIKDRVLLANLEIAGAPGPDYRHRVAWSSFDNPQIFGTPASHAADGTDFQDLFDENGGIGGIAGGSDYALIFKKRAIYRMTFGGALDFSFQPIPMGFGTRYSHSIVRVGMDVFFWGVSGPCVYRGSGNYVEEISMGKVTRSILDDFFSTGGDDFVVNQAQNDPVVCGAADHSIGLVAWTISRLSDSDVAYAQVILVYNYRQGRFSFIDRSKNATRKVVHMFDHLDAVDPWNSMRDIGLVEEDTVADQCIVSKWSRLYGTPADEKSTFKTGFFEFANGQRTKINAVRPVHSLNREAVDPTAIEIVVRTHSRDNPVLGDTVITSNSQSDGYDRKGFIRTPGCPYRSLHAIEVRYGTNRHQIAEIEGFEVEYSVGGEK